jgi:hypothetical protein
MGMFLQLFRFLWARWADYNSVMALLDLFDWKTWLSALAGAVAMVFFGSLNMEWSPQTILLAALAAAAFVAVIIAAVRSILWPRVLVAQIKDIAEAELRDWSLRELFAYLAPHLPPTASKKDGHTTIGTMDTRWEAIGDQVLKQLSLGRLHATGVGYLNVTTRLQAAPIPMEFWRTAKLTYWFLDDDGRGILDAKNAEGIEYSDVEVNRQEAMAIWPHPLSPSIDRMPFTELLSVAADLGWNFSDNSLHLLDLQDAVRQGGADGSLNMWGRLAKYNSDELMRTEPLERIPRDHWREHHAHLFAARKADNLNVYSWSPATKPFGARGYVDLHVDRSQATPWLQRDAAQLKGKTKAK